MKKIKLLLMASALGVMSLFVLKAEEGDPCGCLEDCTTYCQASPIHNCIITYPGGEELKCPYKKAKPILT